MNLRVGDIVTIPVSAYGAYGIVEKVAKNAVTVHTHNAQLTYEPCDVQPYARIVLNLRKYGTYSGNRFHVCRVEYVAGGTKELHIKTKDANDLAEETRALEVRKRAFLQLLPIIH